MSAGWRSVRPMRRRSEHKVVGRDVGTALGTILSLQSSSYLARKGRGYVISVNSL